MHKEPTQIGMPILSVLAAFPGPRDTDSACMIHLSAIRPVARLQRLEPMHGYQRQRAPSGFMQLREITGKRMISCTYEIGKVVT